MKGQRGGGRWASALLAAFLGSLIVASEASALIISELRVRGSNGANDEFVELYNERGDPVTVSTSDGSGGWAVAASDGVTRFVVPNGTTIPPGGHYLGVNSVGYSLASYPAGNATTATGDAVFTTNIPDNAGIALFGTSNPANFNSNNRLDAAGSTGEANALYKEGAGYPLLTPFSIDYSFYRDLKGLAPKDTGDNTADFTFVDTNGTSAGAGQRLGAPGPENLSSPILGRTSNVGISLLEPSAGQGAPPNRVRDFTSDPANNSTFGTLSLRRLLTNSTGAPITRLRFRIADQTTFPAPSGTADLRDRTSSSVVVGSTTVQGTTLEQPPSQPNGSAFNSTLGVGAVTLSDPLDPGESRPVQLLFGIQQTGTFRVCAYIEALPAGGGLIADGGNTQDTSVTTPACAPPPPPSPPVDRGVGDTTAPELTLSGKKKQRLGRAVKVRVECESEPCTATALGKLKAGGKSRGLEPVTRQLAEDQKAILKLRLDRKSRGLAAKALGRGRKCRVRVDVSVVDAAGNEAEASRTVKLKKRKR